MRNHRVVYRSSGANAAVVAIPAGKMLHHQPAHHSHSSQSPQRVAQPQPVIGGGFGGGFGRLWHRLTRLARQLLRLLACMGQNRGAAGGAGAAIIGNCFVIEIAQRIGLAGLR